MTGPVVGFAVQREAFEPAPPSYANMSVIGLVGPAEPATGVVENDFVARFPLNTCVAFQSTGAVARMFDPDGQIGLTLRLINAQMGRMQTSARVVYVRTEEGEDVDETIANIVGVGASFTGLHAFKRAGAVVGYYPRLIGVPGFTEQTTVGATATDIVGGGTGYDAAPTLAMPEGAGNGTGFAATAVLTGGVVTSVVISEPGDGYTPGTYNLTVSGGTPDTAASITVDVGYLANPVAAELPGVLNSFLGVAGVCGGTSNRNAAVDYRETLQSERLMHLGFKASMLDTEGNVVSVDPVGIFLGLHVRRDHEFGGRPFRSILNQPVYGILAPSRNIPFSITDGASEGQDLLEHQCSILVRGESGDDFAIADGGQVFLGFEGLGEDLVWRQFHKVRGRDFIELTVIRTLRTFIGRFNVSVQCIKAVVDTVEIPLSQALAKQEVHGYLVRFDPELNNEDDLRTGHIYVDCRFEEVAVFRKATILSRPHRPALTQAIESLLASNVLVGA